MKLSTEEIDAIIGMMTGFAPATRLDPATVLALASEVKTLRADAARLDWLETKVIEARENYVEFSDIFWAYPTEDGPSPVRALIDVELAEAKATPQWNR